MKYFLHDTNSFDDEKVTELFMKFGYEGLGLFYTVLEKLAKQEKPVKTDVLKAQLKVGKRLNKCWTFMEEIGIIHSNNGETFNKQLLNFSEKYQIKKEKTRKKVSEWREKQKDSETVTSYVPIRNALKVKESKVKESKEDNNIPTFEEFKEHALSKKPNLLTESIKLKYDAWIENGWKDGNNKKILNWKSKLTNTVSYLKVDSKFRNPPEEYKAIIS